MPLCGQVVVKSSNPAQAHFSTQYGQPDLRIPAWFAITACQGVSHCAESFGYASENGSFFPGYIQTAAIWARFTLYALPCAAPPDMPVRASPQYVSFELWCTLFGATGTLRSSFHSIASSGYNACRSFTPPVKLHAGADWAVAIVADRSLGVAVPSVSILAWPKGRPFVVPRSSP